jgi:thioesterase domain-containing protein
MSQADLTRTVLFISSGGGFNVFSTGVDVLAKQLRARGIDATAYGNADWPAVTEKATNRYTVTHQPIILVGHSFGANAAVLLAAELEKARIPVALIVLYDTVSSMKVTGNVRRVVDFVSSDGRTMGRHRDGRARLRWAHRQNRGAARSLHRGQGPT